MSGKLQLSHWFLAHPLADMHVAVHHNVLKGTAVSTDKRLLELHLKVKEMWMSRAISLTACPLPNHTQILLNGDIALTCISKRFNYL